MPYCYKCGSAVKETSKYCPSCGFELNKTQKVAGRELEEEEREPSARPHVTEKIIIQEKERSGGSGIGALILVLLIIGGIILFIYLSQEGGPEKALQNYGCKRSFDECNTRCGEGWGSGLCKTGCTSEYNKCLERGG